MFEYFDENFEWGSLSQEDIKFIISEYCGANTYELWGGVKEGDIVVDIGSSVGPFCYSALSKGAKKVYCIEPSKELIKTNIINNSKFILNKKESPVVYINKAVDYKTSDETKESLKNNNTIVFGNNKKFETISFKDIIERYNIKKINFLKIDCEGGEYSIFTEENFDYLINNVDFISCEMHGRCFPNLLGIEYFKKFRDTFLSKIPRKSYKITCNVDGLLSDVTDWFITDSGCVHILSNTEIMVYIKNR